MKHAKLEILGLILAIIGAIITCIQVFSPPPEQLDSIDCEIIIDGSQGCEIIED